MHFCRGGRGELASCGRSRERTRFGVDGAIRDEFRLLPRTLMIHEAESRDWSAESRLYS